MIGFPGTPCYWFENPKGKDGHWKKHVICKSACNETPQYVDLFGTGKRVLVMGYLEKQMVYLTPGAGPDAAVGDSPDQRSGEGGARHQAVRSWPRRRRHQRRRPARRDLHAGLVGAAGEGRRQDAVEVPPRQPRRRLCRHVHLRPATATARPTSSAARPTAMASGRTTRCPGRTIRPSSRWTCSRSSFRRRTPCTSSTSMATA